MQRMFRLRARLASRYSPSGLGLGREGLGLCSSSFAGLPQNSSFLSFSRNPSGVSWVEVGKANEEAFYETETTTHRFCGLFYVEPRRLRGERV
jgi:hypothetical protein